MLEGSLWKSVVDICDGEIKCSLMSEDLFDEINVDWVMDDNSVPSAVLVVAELWISFTENDMLTEPKISEKRVVVSTKPGECVTDLSYWLLDDKMSSELNETFKG